MIVVVFRAFLLHDAVPCPGAVVQRAAARFFQIMAATRRVINRIGRPVHFLHIPKTGGSAVRHALREAWSFRYRLVLHSHGVTLQRIPRGEAVVAFLRDPITRFYSAFYSRKRQGRPRYDVPWSDAERLAFERFPHANDLAEALSAPLETDRWAARIAMASIQHVNAPMSDWLGTPEYVLTRKEDLLYVGFQETLNADYEKLCRRLGLHAQLGLPSDAVLAHRNPVDAGPPLTERSVANLSIYYKSDVQLLSRLRQVASESG